MAPSLPIPLRLIQALIPRRLHRFMGIATSSAYGKARWMNRKEMAAFLSPRHTGLALSPALRLSQDASFRNLGRWCTNRHGSSGAGGLPPYPKPHLLSARLWPICAPTPYHDARTVAPGWDVYYLEQEWRRWCGKEEIEPKRPGKHFLSFCKTWYENHGSP